MAQQQSNYSIANLFDLPSPEDLQYYRQQQNLAEAVKATPDNVVRQSFGFAGRQLGQGLNTMLGGRDPELERVTKVRSIGQQISQMVEDPTNPDEVYPMMIKAFSEQGLQKEAMMVAQQYENTRKDRAQALLNQRKAESEAFDLEQEKKMQAELAQLPPNASDEQVMQVIKKYAKADKLATIMTNSADKAAERENKRQINADRIQAQADAVQQRLEMQIEMKKSDLENRLAIARMNNASAKEIAAMRQDTALQIAQMRADSAKTVSELKAAAKEDAPLDDKAAVKVGHNSEYEDTLQKGKSMLDEIKKNKSAFTLGGRAKALANSSLNPDDPNVKALSNVEAFMKKARNAYLLEAKGTQTEGDAQRAWEEFAGKLDFASPEGAKRSVERIMEEIASKKEANSKYLKSRYPKKYGNGSGTADDPIKLD